ncbi:uncharacterized protein AB9W97_006807 [Spinachia spinachia]
MLLKREPRPCFVCYTQTDASNSGMGAVLSQEVQGEDRPVLYISRKLSEREGPYSTSLAWVRYHRPATLEAAVTLAEDHLAVHPGGWLAYRVITATPQAAKEIPAAGWGLAPANLVVTIPSTSY